MEPLCYMEPSSLLFVYRVYYKCMGTNMSIQAFDKRKPGETTLIQTSNVRSTIQVPRTLKWSEISFLAQWTLENENYPLQVQNPVRNPELGVSYNDTKSAGKCGH